MNTDPIADLLVRIKNGYLAKKLEVAVPYSKPKENITIVLEKYGFIDSYMVEGEKAKKQMVIQLKYDDKDRPAIENYKRISKPGLRVYVGSQRILNVHNGYGLAIVSTSQGIMAGHEAKASNLGGEVIAYVW